MPVVKNGKLVYIAHPLEPLYRPEVHSKYVEEDFNTDTVVLNGGVLVRLIAVSSDPYMRYRMRKPEIPLFAPPAPLNQAFDHYSVGQIVCSEDPQFAVGFANYSVYPDGDNHILKHCVKISKVPGVPLSTFVVTLGLTGKSAYTGWTLFGQEKAATSKTLSISDAGGAVGIFLIQYVKLVSPHLKIIATAGPAEKIELCKQSGADVVFKYKTVNVEKTLAEYGPIDIYWDNTAGSILDAVLANISFFGLIIACGAISEMSGDSSGHVKNFGKIFQNCVTVRSFLVGFGPEATAAAVKFMENIPPLVASGMIRVPEHRFEGLEKAGEALESVQSGKNLGKAVVIAGPE